MTGDRNPSDWGDVPPDAKPKAHLTPEDIEAWEAEQYAAVKMRLFQAFDEVEDMMGQGRRLLVTPEFLEEVLSNLGVE